MVYYRHNNDYYDGIKLVLLELNLSKKKAGNIRFTNNIIILKLTNVVKRILIAFFKALKISWIP